MSEREMRRAAVLAQVKSGCWTLVVAAERMELSYRQAKRLWKRYRSQGTAGLVHGSDGALYGTTRIGGPNSYGTVFKVNKDGSGYQVLYSFILSTEGGWPVASLVEDTAGAVVRKFLRSQGTKFLPFST